MKLLENLVVDVWEVEKVRDGDISSGPKLYS